jgi:transcriptional regulator with XRE-family HTH domain
MADSIDFNTASPEQIEAALGVRIERVRLSRNITQQQLADEAGVSIRTIRRLARGDGVSLDTFIRVLTALHIQPNLGLLLPDPTISPVERIRAQHGERLRARPNADSAPASIWTWDDGENDD